MPGLLRVRPVFIPLVLLWMLALLMLAHQLMRAELIHREHEFIAQAQGLAERIEQRLSTNDVVITAFSAFLRAVDQSDGFLADSFAAPVVGAYPHIYMLEVARRVAPLEEPTLARQMQALLQSDFSFKRFSDIAPTQGGQADGLEGASWPILFLFPRSSQTEPIYGVRLESVKYLAGTMQTALAKQDAIASPVFELYEGGSAYILLRSVDRRAALAPTGKLNLFGDQMLALMVVKVDRLFEGATGLTGIGIEARLAASGVVSGPVWQQAEAAASSLDRLTLPRFSYVFSSKSTSQPFSIQFSQQVVWGDLMTANTLSMALLLVLSLFMVPMLAYRHLHALNRAELDHQRAAYLATHDVLTHLPNRQLVSDRYEQLALRAARSGQRFALLLIDLDHFKEINDRFGHTVGDQVLLEVAHRMVATLRASDTVGRMGGDEFIALIDHLASPDDVQKVAEKVLEAVAVPIDTEAGPLSVSCSIGIAFYPEDGVSMNILCKSADLAMYSVKHAGRNGVAVAAGSAMTQPV